jgi:hypothetical protein
MTHCCEQMDFFLEEERVGIFYDKKTRFYGINLRESSGVQKIDFCPWCNARLPGDLSEKYAQLVFDELEFNPLDKNYKKNLPAEFKSDEWWKKRNL